MKIKEFDAYAKTLDDFRIKTPTGGILSLSTSIILIILVSLHSFHFFFQNTTTRTQLLVDASRRERMPIEVDITFHKLHCEFLTLDVMDMSGEQQNELVQNIEKVSLTKEGDLKPKTQKIVKEKAISIGCGDCYGAPPPASGCCQTCQDVRDAYARARWAVESYSKFQQCVDEGMAELWDFDKVEGCRLRGQFEVNKVSGNFHISIGHSYQHGMMHVHDLQMFQGHFDQLDFTHTIHSLRFGPKTAQVQTPLDGRRIEEQHSNYFQYFIKVIPTQVEYLNQTILETNQYSVTQYHKMNKQEEEQHTLMTNLPGLFFTYDISPMMVMYIEERKGFVQFLSEICAMIGGLFTFARVMDGFLWRAESLMKKVELGKHQ